MPEKHEEAEGEGAEVEGATLTEGVEGPSGGEVGKKGKKGEKGKNGKKGEKAMKMDRKCVT